ncbi:TetR/AcrR family transcriptional regulator [Streptomyces sp. NPDC101455]|uniref:TetR/AcrR family transcriptional regulator n=1 Tax=Streptomyces sp. NPDC101455 TaxID=3366142 RepID=UPI0037F7CF6E
MPAERDVLLRGLEAFAELGYDRASARELARRLGVSHTFINDRYGSKAAFWRAVVDSALGDQLKRMPPVDAAADDADVVRRLIRGFYCTIMDDPHLARLIADEGGRDTERLDYLYDRYIEPTLAQITPSVERLTAAGRMARMPRDVLFFAIIGPGTGLVREPLSRRLGRPADMSKEGRLAQAETLAALVVGGLLASGDANADSNPSPSGSLGCPSRPAVTRLPPSSARPADGSPGPRQGVVIPVSRTYELLEEESVVASRPVV